jgi:hypothetical protein
VSYLTHLCDLGFDRSEHIPFTKQYRVRCSQCDALVISGTPTHERGCPNRTYECNGCGAIVTGRQRYCEDCS